MSIRATILRGTAMLAIASLVSGLPLEAARAAGTATTNFNVSLTITAGCTVSATAMAFGTSQMLNTNVSSTSVVSPICTNTTPYTVALDAGGGTGATVAARKLTGPGGSLVTYSLYQDAAFGTVWGNTVGTNTVGGTGNGVAQPLTVFGKIPAQAAATPGVYADVIGVTVAY